MGFLCLYSFITFVFTASIAKLFFRTRSWGYGGRTGRGHNGNYGWGDGVDGHYDQQSGRYQASGHHDQQLDPNREQRDIDEAINR